MYKVGIVAAMEREVRPLVRRWQISEKEHLGRRFRFFEKGSAVVVCGGIGAEAARRAAEAVIASYSPAIVYSAGFAGALAAELKVGDVILPRTVIHAGDGSRTEVEVGGGVLVSFGSVASPQQKTALREGYAAQAVDMEAAHVARAAQLRGVRFGAVKVISDEFDFDFPSTERFIDPSGCLLETRFALYVATRPWLWPSVFCLARNSARAARALSAWLEANLGRMSGETDETPFKAVSQL